MPACRTLDCVSVLALTVDDADRRYRAIAGFDPDDPFSSRRHRRGSRLPRPTGRGSACRCGRAGSSAATPSPNAPSDATLDDIAALGVGAEADIDFAPFFAAGTLVYDGPWVAERDHAVGDFIRRRPDAVEPGPADHLHRGRGFRR